LLGALNYFIDVNGERTTIARGAGGGHYDEILSYRRYLQRSRLHLGHGTNVSFVLAWRILTFDKARTGLALAGIFMAITLVFIQLGLFYAVPQGGMLLYDNMRFDLLLASDQYEYQAQPGAFPLSRLTAVRGSQDVAAATPLYFAVGKWKGGVGGVWPDVFVIGFDPASRVLTPDSIATQSDALGRPDTILVDSTTRPFFGPLDPGRIIQIGDRNETIGGQYELGTGFMGLGVALTSTANFARLFPQRGVGLVNLGAIRLKPGVDPDAAIADLRKLAGANTQLFTRARLARLEASYWTTRTSVGLIFGSGLLISIVVGIMVVYQIVSAQVARQLPQFATLKAIGYSDGALAGTVAAMSVMIAVTGFVPALAAAYWLYDVIRRETLLPVTMSIGHIAGVFVAALLMASISALLAVGGLRRADPADVF
jgi:putative ABC transport system permease protein